MYVYPDDARILLVGGLVVQGTTLTPFKIKLII